MNLRELITYLSLLSRGGSLFFFLIKRTKNQVNSNASLSHKPRAAKPGSTTGFLSFAPLRSHVRTLQQILRDPCLRTGHQCRPTSAPKLGGDGDCLNSDLQN